MTRESSSFMQQIAAAKKDAAKLREVMGDSARIATFPPLASPSGAGLGGAVASSEAVERAAFEAWIRRDGGDLSTFGSGKNLHYHNSAVNNAWGGWKIRAALASQPGCAVEGEAVDLIRQLGEALDFYVSQAYSIKGAIAIEAYHAWQARTALQVNSTEMSEGAKGSRTDGKEAA